LLLLLIKLSDHGWDQDLEMNKSSKNEAGRPVPCC
jgi:hypothetical protein